jgi:hypothetical protein
MEQFNQRAVELPSGNATPSTLHGKYYSQRQSQMSTLGHGWTILIKELLNFLLEM